VVEGKPEGMLAPSETIIPLSLDKGKGMQGIGLIEIKGEGLVNNLLITVV